MHLAIDLLKGKLVESRQRTLSGFIHLMVFLFALSIMVVGGIRLIYITHTLGQISAAMRLPMTAVYAVLPLSGVLVMYYKINELVHLRAGTNAVEDED